MHVRTVGFDAQPSRLSRASRSDRQRSTPDTVDREPQGANHQLIARSPGAKRLQFFEKLPLPKLAMRVRTRPV